MVPPPLHAVGPTVTTLDAMLAFPAVLQVPTVVIYIAAAYAGWAGALTAWFPRLTVLERLSLSAPLSLVTSAWAVLLASHLLGRMTPGMLLVSAALHAGLYAMAARGPNKATWLWRELRGKGERPARAALAGWFLTACVCSVVTWITHTHSLYHEPDRGLWTGGNCYSDLPFHLSVLNSFVHGENSFDFSLASMHEAIYAGNPLVYPIIPDYYSATLVVGGLSLRWSLFVPTTIMAWAFFFILYAFAYRFARGSHVAGVAAVYLTAFCGGNYDFGEPSYWLFFIKDIFMPQRSAMFAYSVDMGVFIALMIGMDVSLESIRAQRADESSKLHGFVADTPAAAFERRRYFVLAGVWTGLLPWLQGHSFISATMIGAFMISGERFLTRWPPRHLLLRNLLWPYFLDGLAYGIPSLVIGVPQVLIFVGPATGKGFGKWIPMWLAGGRQGNSFFEFYWQCLGLFFYASILATPLLDAPERRRYVGFWVLFFASTYYKFQPWNVDNMKLFYVWYVGAAAAVGTAYARLQKKSVILRLAGFALLLSFMIPAMVQVYREAVRQSHLMSEADIKLADWTIENTPPDAVFLTSTRHSHPIPALAGRSVLMGYKGWLHSRNYPYSTRVRAAKQIYRGDPSAPALLKQYGIDYIVLSHQTKDVEGVVPNRDWMKKTFRRVYLDGSWVVFSVHERPLGKQ